MGQPINVVEKPGHRPGLLRLETDRWLTGMGHERYRSAEDIVDDKTVDELARRLFATGHVAAVHVNGSVVTVELASEDAPTGDLADVVRNLHIHYPDGAAEPEPEPESVAGDDAVPTDAAG